VNLGPKNKLVVDINGYGQELEFLFSDFLSRALVALHTSLDRCSQKLFWDTGGFVLYYKRLERGRFKLPKLHVDQQAIELDATTLSMLPDGIDYERVKRKNHWQPKNVQAGSTNGVQFDQPL
jgi:hypothetical protein